MGPGPDLFCRPRLLPCLASALQGDPTALAKTLACVGCRFSRRLTGLRRSGGEGRGAPPALAWGPAAPRAPAQAGSSRPSLTLPVSAPLFPRLPRPSPSSPLGPRHVQLHWCLQWSPSSPFSKPPPAWSFLENSGTRFPVHGEVAETARELCCHQPGFPSVCVRLPLVSCLLLRCAVPALSSLCAYTFFFCNTGV